MGYGFLGVAVRPWYVYAASAILTNVPLLFMEVSSKDAKLHPPPSYTNALTPPERLF